MYDDALRPARIRTTQYSLLGHLSRTSDVRVCDLAAALQIDETTLPRNLRPLDKRGLVKVRQGSDRREKRVSITPAGRKLLVGAAPLWIAVQERLRGRVRAVDWAAALRALPRIAAATAAK
jgi:DNA-binding MarR family transcriptional regulator